MTRREEMTCNDCGEVHTTDALFLYGNGVKIGTRVCAFCHHRTETWTADGAPTRLDKKMTVTREEDRLEAEEELGGIP